MKKYALMLAVALLAAPASAVVNITAVDMDAAGPGLVAQISYACTAGEKVAAFALDIQVDGGAVITAVGGYKVSVSTAASKGYGIFPANFDRYITVNAQGGVDDWGVAGYTPAAEAGDKGALGGIGTSGITVEMGALYKGDPNAPGPAGNLLTVEVDKACNLSVTTNAIRGNVVLEGATEATVSLAAATNVPIGGGVIECLPTTHPDYNTWVNVGKPECWCIKTQCHGDADGLKEGSTKTGFWRVHFRDLNTLLAGWNTKEPTMGPGISTVTFTDGIGSVAGICADFAHDVEGSTKTGFFRVHFNDLNILIANWNVKEPTFGPGIPKDCGGTIDPQP